MCACVQPVLKRVFHSCFAAFPIVLSLTAYLDGGSSRRSDHCMCHWHREQIANFVVQNSHGGIYFAAVPMNVDPFTGAGAYVPNSSTRSGASLGGYGGSSDPFTGGGAYVPGAVGAASRGMSGGYSVTGGNVDPYTGEFTPPCCHGVVLVTRIEFES